MGFGSEPPTLKRQRQPSREIDRERIGFASSKDEERSLRLMLLIVVMNSASQSSNIIVARMAGRFAGLGALSSCGAQSLL